MIEALVISEDLAAGAEKRNGPADELPAIASGGVPLDATRDVDGQSREPGETRTLGETLGLVKTPDGYILVSEEGIHSSRPMGLGDTLSFTAAGERLARMTAIRIRMKSAWPNSPV
ncbi:MAG: hypothetical protein WKF30_15405 [Pyrinomonadaceae bacterium]